uniref:Aspartoacylase n=1 Tax=Attheya septentrionalis TaxID=420275 RepID=A0A7S2UKJ8_9STRA|mmetsp:Transcript_26222/g.47583  ORF Transcript_26222/g.47583 Transcript_26222/m.47583 type:complete len:382 (+) Transcript_26222:110-1255(+)|eukprot:CAMPEP_0198284680 /NCGR_PEP_ID=MMETSP1449-20131203/4141_1 /TAXON_ID=420275 /ORGANISM="Attheya septentrionalis, Strain CCMP2084" /LENGTH=381 /DNA_ID=CAMNT_0043981879 /DNA_START=81 /DNA_END=1226 /DNA_ORIENTATION=+
MIRTCLLLYLPLVFAFPTAVSWKVAPPNSSVNVNKIESIVVVGGTHGNEYTGVWCIKELDAKPELVGKQYPSLKISTLVGNPEAHLANRRFIDTDLNREFTHAKLMVGEEGLPLTVESLRAREIEKLLGPKFVESPDTTDLVVDLHTTTTNMGITLIIPEGDALMAQAAAYVLHKCLQTKERISILMHAIPDRHHRPNVGSTARHGFTIEVGPVPQGVLRHDAVEKTRKAMHFLFDFLEQRNAGKDPLKDISEVFPSGRVPCYRSAKAQRPGEISGKIPWPCTEDNPNFPLFMVHKSLQDRDFHLIKTGDPLFVTIEGDTIYYEGSHGDQVYLIFINEGGYYYESSGTGIGVAVKTEYDLLQGYFADETVCDNSDPECNFE